MIIQQFEGYVHEVYLNSLSFRAVVADLTDPSRGNECWTIDFNKCNETMDNMKTILPGDVFTVDIDDKDGFDLKFTDHRRIMPGAF